MSEVQYQCEHCETTEMGPQVIDETVWHWIPEDGEYVRCGRMLQVS